MPCQHVKLPDGGFAIVCSRGPRRSNRCKCGRDGAFLCDWKITKADQTTTCDRPLCETCAHEVAPEKHLCPTHVRVWAKHPKNPAATVTIAKPPQP